MLVAGSHRTIRAHPRVFYTTLAVVAGVAFAIALWDLTMGGFYFRVLGVRLSSWESYKPFAHWDARDRRGNRDAGLER